MKAGPKVIQLLESGWPLILCGVVLVGLGGLGTTLGWSNVAKQRQARSLLLAVQQEWSWNDSTLNTNPLFIDNQDSILRKYELYPRLREGALSNVLASGLFANRSADFQRLLHEVVEYQGEVRYLNRLFDLSDNYVVQIRSQDSIASHHRYVQKSQKYTDFQTVHGRFGKFIDTFLAGY